MKIPAASVLEDRKRRSRTTLVVALVLLFMIWTVKLSFPHQTALSVYHYDLDSSLAATATDKKVSELSREKVAVIIDTRYNNKLIPLILHFSSVLGPSWPIVIYTTVEIGANYNTSAALARYIQSGQIQIRYLLEDTDLSTSVAVSGFLTERWLWENLDPWEHILIFQSDSMICSNSARSVEDFFEYDFIGAPIDPRYGAGYNGGLSLRKRSTILRVLENYEREETAFEDQFYYSMLEKLKAIDEEKGIRAPAKGAINLPDVEVAKTFSVETIDYPQPLGLHQVGRYLPDSVAMMDEWCPEYRMSGLGGDTPWA